jgi:hypothetical protein
LHRHILGCQTLAIVGKPAVCARRGSILLLFFFSAIQNFKHSIRGRLLHEHHLALQRIVCQTYGRPSTLLFGDDVMDAPGSGKLVTPRRVFAGTATY